MGFTFCRFRLLGLRLRCTHHRGQRQHAEATARILQKLATRSQLLIVHNKYSIDVQESIETHHCLTKIGHGGLAIALAQFRLPFQERSGLLAERELIEAERGDDELFPASISPNRPRKICQTPVANPAELLCQSAELRHQLVEHRLQLVTNHRNGRGFRD